MQTFTDGDRIKIQGKKRMYYGTVGTLAAAYGKSDYFKSRWPTMNADFFEDMYRRQDGNRFDAWATQRASVICADPGFYDREKAWQDACREVKDGETVLLDGKPYRVKFVGDYQSIIYFYAA